MKVINLGLIKFQQAYLIQKKLNQDIYEGKEDETILICHHPAIVTLGKKSTSLDLTGWTGEVVAIERGGQATYHGPSQVVAYPLLDLRKRNNDIYLYLRNLETAVINTLIDFGIIAEGDTKNTGVWYKEKKIASIGVAVKRWITYHGLAINIFQDSLAFQGISPCGMSPDVMTNLEFISKKTVNREFFELALSNHLIKVLKLKKLEQSEYRSINPAIKIQSELHK